MSWKIWNPLKVCKAEPFPDMHSVWQNISAHFLSDLFVHQLNESNSCLPFNIWRNFWVTIDPSLYLYFVAVFALLLGSIWKCLTLHDLKTLFCKEGASVKITLATFSNNLCLVTNTEENYHQRIFLLFCSVLSGRQVTDMAVSDIQRQTFWKTICLQRNFSAKNNYFCHIHWWKHILKLILFFAMMMKRWTHFCISQCHKFGWSVAFTASLFTEC